MELEASLQNSGEEKSLLIDVVKLSEELPFRDFVMSLKLRPEEVTVWNLQITHCHKEMGTTSLISTKGTLGMACSILLHEILSRNLSDSRIQKAPTLPVIVRPRFSNFPSCDPHEVDGNNDDLDISGEDGGCSFSELRAGRVGQMVYSYMHTYILYT